MKTNLRVADGIGYLMQLAMLMDITQMVLVLLVCALVIRQSELLLMVDARETWKMLVCSCTETKETDDDTTCLFLYI